jgi:DNA-binding transcriptional ArsR family regulator
MGDSKARQNTKGKTATLDNRLAQACSHPLRAQLLAILTDRCASPVELTELVDAQLSNVSYHVKQLRELDCIEAVSKEQKRGAIKTKYRATTQMLLDDGNWKKLNRETRKGISINAVGESIDLVTNALQAGTFDKRTDRHVINMKVDLDEQGWDEVAAIIALAYDRLSRVPGDSANRTPDSAKRFRATVSLLSYESPSPEDRGND